MRQRDDLAGVTRRLNGGVIGLDQRKQWLIKWKHELATNPAPSVNPDTPVAVVSPPQIRQTFAGWISSWFT